MERSATRFPVFESARIFIPGLYFMCLLIFLLTGFEIPFGPFSSSYTTLAIFLTGAAVAGLSLYAKATPKHRKAFLNNQPSRFILERSRQLFPASPFTEEESRQLYFYLLNVHVPPVVHEKIFFFGTIYHIMVYIRRISFWFGVTGTAGLIVQLSISQVMTAPSVFTVVVIWLIYALNVRYNKADRKMQENYHDQIFWLEMNRETVDAAITQRRHRT